MYEERGQSIHNRVIRIIIVSESCQTIQNRVNRFKIGSESCQSCHNRVRKIEPIDSICYVATDARFGINAKRSLNIGYKQA